MSRLSTKNYNPRATGSLRHLMLKVLARHTLTAPYRLNYSICFPRQDNPPNCSGLQSANGLSRGILLPSRGKGHPGLSIQV